MNSVYLLVGEDSFALQQKVSSIQKKYPTFEVVHYDLKETPLERVLEDLDTFSFFTPGKIVVAENAYFFSSEKPRNALEQNTASLEKYLSHPSQENILLLLTSKLDERKAITKLAHKTCHIEEASLDLDRLLTTHLEDYQMDFATREYLKSRVGNIPERLVQEIEKLKLYCYDTKQITKEVIGLLVMETLEDNIFHLIDAIVQKRKQEAFALYEDMLLHGEEPTIILILLANRYRLFYQVKVLSKSLYRDEEIARVIGSHPYPVKLARSVISQYKEEELLQFLEQLASIDFAIKSGKTYQNVALEMFFLRL